MADVSLLGYTTFQDIVTNYSSSDARAQFVMPKRVLDRQTPLIRLLPMKASNNILSNIAVRTDSLPVAVTRRFNEGIKETASKNTPINDPIALFEDRSEVDYELWRNQNDPKQWRSDQDMNHVEGMFQSLEATLFYGSLANNAGGFNGLATRFNNLTSLPNGDAQWHANVWDGGSTAASAVTSAWIIEFGEDSIYGIYPPNSPAGLNVRDLGEYTRQIAITANSATSGTYKLQVLGTLLNWYMGMQIADERAVQRIANINPVALGTGNFDENVFIQAINMLPRAGDAPGTAILVNRPLKTQMDIRAVSQKTNAYYTQDTGTGDIWGRRVTRFQGIPILVAEKILSTETVVTA